MCLGMADVGCRCLHTTEPVHTTPIYSYTKGHEALWALMGVSVRRPMLLKQIGPIVDKRPVRRQLDGYEEEEYPDRSGPDLYRAMRGYPRMGSGDRCGLQLPDPGFALSRIRSTAVCYRSRNWECLEICAERWKTVVDLWPGDRVLNLNMEVPRSGVQGTQPRYRIR